MYKRSIFVWRIVSIFAVLTMLFMAGCGPAQTPTAEPKPAEVEPTKAEPAPAEPTKAEPAPVEPTEAEPAPAEPISDQVPRMGGTIIAGYDTDPSTLVPAMTSESNAMMIGSKMHNTLLVLDANLNPTPGSGLAESWDISEDGTTYTFHLREGVQWHDGEPFTCADVQYTFGEFLPKYGPSGSYLGAVEEITCPDDNTAVFQLKAPFAPFLLFFKMDGGCVVPKHIYEGTDVLENPANLEPVGTGPFILEEWVRGDHITLVRNPNYFMKGRPFLDKIIFKLIPEATSAVTAMDAGEIDYLADYVPPKSDVARWAEDPEYRILANLEPQKRVTLFFNILNEDCKPCMDPEVRRAVSYGIDRQEIVDLTKFGLAQPIYSIFDPKITWAYDAQFDEPHYDPDMANQILDEAGYPRGDDGMRFPLVLTYQTGYSVAERPVEVIKEQLKEVGIDIILSPMEKAAMIEKVQAQYDYEIWVHRMTSDGDPGSGIDRFVTCAGIDPTKTWVNESRYCNPEVDELFEQGLLATTKEARGPYYLKIAEILQRDLPILHLWMPTTTDVTRMEFYGHFFISWPADHNWDFVWWLPGEPMEEGSYEPVVFPFPE